MIQPILHYYDFGQHITAFSTTRQGGYSRGAYGAFNINVYCGDEHEAIRHNRMSLCRLLNIQDDHLLMPHQVHLTKVANIDEAFMQQSQPARQTLLEGVDALMTHLPGVCIGVSTADCIPVLLYDPQHQAVCAIHAGWRGTVSRIVEQAVKKMMETYDTQPADILAQIGPGISLDSFEVGDEVYDAFQQAGFEMSIISEHRDKWHIDLPECNRRQLLSMGLCESHIHDDHLCTYQLSDTYFSARRLGIQSGRIFTGILLHQQHA